MRPGPAAPGGGEVAEHGIWGTAGLTARLRERVQTLSFPNRGSGASPMPADAAVAPALVVLRLRFRLAGGARSRVVQASAAASHRRWT